MFVLLCGLLVWGLGLVFNVVLRLHADFEFTICVGYCLWVFPLDVIAGCYVTVGF